MKFVRNAHNILYLKIVIKSFLFKIQLNISDAIPTARPKTPPNKNDLAIAQQEEPKTPDPHTSHTKTPEISPLSLGGTGPQPKSPGSPPNTLNKKLLKKESFLSLLGTIMEQPQTPEAKLYGRPKTPLIKTETPQQPQTPNPQPTTPSIVVTPDIDSPRPQSQASDSLRRKVIKKDSYMSLWEALRAEQPKTDEIQSTLRSPFMKNDPGMRRQIETSPGQPITYAIPSSSRMPVTPRRPSITQRMEYTPGTQASSLIPFSPFSPKTPHNGPIELFSLTSPDTQPRGIVTNEPSADYKGKQPLKESYTLHVEEPFEGRLNAMMQQFEKKLENFDIFSEEYKEAQIQMSWVNAYFDIMIRILDMKYILAETDTKIGTVLLKDTDYLNGPKVTALLNDETIAHLETFAMNVVTDYRNLATRISLMATGYHQRKLLNAITKNHRNLNYVEIEIALRKMHEIQRRFDARASVNEKTDFQNVWTNDYEVELNKFFKHFSRVKQICVHIEKMDLAQRTSDYFKNQIYFAIGQLHLTKKNLDKSYENVTKAFDKLFEVQKDFTETLYAAVASKCLKDDCDICSKNI